MTREEKYSYVAKYLAGELDAAEIPAFKAWLSESTEHLEMLETSIMIWQASRKTREVNTLKSWNRLQKRIEPKRRSFPFLQAAMILVLLGIGLWFFLGESTPQPQPMVFETMDGETKELVLADSSLVVLSPASKLVVNYPWLDQRTMTFSGKAYFKVSRDEQRPFKVQTAEGEVQVLGTAFYVDTRKESRNNIVAVEEGKVRFVNQEKKVNIDIPIGFALPNAERETLALKPISQLDSYWMNHTLMYSKESISIILEDIERIFHCEIKVETSEILNCKFSGKFKDNSINEILEVIAFALDLKINKMANSRFSLSGKGC